jgi:hypothetical protein
MELTQVEKDRMVALKAIKEKANPPLTPAQVKELADLEAKLAKKP